jgi:hypothetical protein
VKASNIGWQSSSPSDCGVDSDKTGGTIVQGCSSFKALGNSLALRMFAQKRILSDPPKSGYGLPVGRLNLPPELAKLR